MALVAASARYLDVELWVHRCCLCVTARTIAMRERLVEETRPVSPMSTKTQFDLDSPLF